MGCQVVAISIRPIKTALRDIVDAVSADVHPPDVIVEYLSPKIARRNVEAPFIVQETIVPPIDILLIIRK